jgi:hypothetical protein
MGILKKGIRFAGQDAGAPITEEEIPFIIHSLSPEGLRRAAIAGFYHLYQQGCSINGALEILGEEPKENA